MTKYVLHRVLRSIPVIFGVTVLVFSMVDFLPGDPVLYMFQATAISAENIAKARHALGLDLPVHIRYLRWLGNALQGDLGVSIESNRPVLELIARVFPETIKLTLFSMLVAVLLGMTAGIVAAIKQGSWLDTLGMVFVTAGVSMPLFWIGLLVLWFFAVQHQWFPVAGGYGWKGLILPGLTMGVRSSCLIARLTRSSMLEVLRQDYLITARAKGLAEWVVLTRHAMKNALIPVVTILGLQIGWMLGGAVIVESVFARPGIGRLAVGAIQRHNFPVVQGTILLAAVAYVSVNLVVDVCYAYLDPRIQYQ